MRLVNVQKIQKETCYFSVWSPALLALFNERVRSCLFLTLKDQREFKIYGY